MSIKMYDELALEREINAGFGVDMEILQPIVYRVPISRSAEATLFLNNKKQLYLYISGQSKLLLGDIKKTVSRMGLVADIYFPPKGQPRYFEEAALSKFLEVFPGRKNVSDEDLIFYRTLVSYNPALILISEVKNGEIYQFDSDSHTSWRLATKFAYRRIKTS